MALIRLLTSRTIGLQAAALPIQRTPAGRLMVGLVTSRGSGRWVLPKGWCSPGRSPFETAAMEAREEAGLIGEIGDTPIGRYRYRKGLHTLASMMCEVHVFRLEVTEQLAKWPEMKQRRAAFCEPIAAARMVDEEELAALLRSL